MGKRWAGPRIKARTWTEAERKARRLNVKLTGELIAEYDEDQELIYDCEDKKLGLGGI
jgi:hypothetical protein